MSLTSSFATTSPAPPSTEANALFASTPTIQSANAVPKVFSPSLPSSTLSASDKLTLGQLPTDILVYNRPGSSTSWIPTLNFTHINPTPSPLDPQKVTLESLIGLADREHEIYQDLYAEIIKKVYEAGEFKFSQDHIDELLRIKNQRNSAFAQILKYHEDHGGQVKQTSPLLAPQPQGRFTGVLSPVPKARVPQSNVSLDYLTTSPPPAMPIQTPIGSSFVFDAYPPLHTSFGTAKLPKFAIRVTDKALLSSNGNLFFQVVAKLDEFDANPTPGFNFNSPHPPIPNSPRSAEILHALHPVNMEDGTTVFDGLRLNLDSFCPDKIWLSFSLMVKESPSTKLQIGQTFTLGPYMIGSFVSPAPSPGPMKRKRDPTMDDEGPRPKRPKSENSNRDTWTPPPPPNSSYENIYVDITDLLGLPQKEAASKLGISESMLCKRFKECTRRKWPYRYLRKIEKTITQLENAKEAGTITQDDEDKLEELVRQRIDCLSPVRIRITTHDKNGAFNAPQPPTGGFATPPSESESDDMDYVAAEALGKLRSMTPSPKPMMMMGMGLNPNA